MCDWKVINSIIHVLVNGLPWHEAPPDYGPHKTLYNRWKRWCDKGIFQRMLQAPASESGNTRVLMMDSTHIKAHRVACSLSLLVGRHGRKIGRTAGGLNCKLHIVTDAAGRPVLMYLTAGNASGYAGAKAVFADLPRAEAFFGLQLFPGGIVGIDLTTFLGKLRRTLQQFR